MRHLVGSLVPPTHPAPFHPLADDRLAGRLDRSGTDRPAFRPQAPIRPGDVWNLAEEVDATGEPISPTGPDAKYLQADSAFVAAGWDGFQAYLDHVLEMNGVPPATIRMTQDSVRSGVSIVAEQIPLLLWAEAR